MSLVLPRRPVLQPGLSPAAFAQFYWLKAELLAFCRQQGLATNGGKLDIAQRIGHWLRTGEKLAGTPAKTAAPSRRTPPQALTLTALIPVGCRSDERHRAFFKQAIGPHFRFTVAFMAFLRTQARRPYAEAVAEWQRAHRAKQAGEKTAVIAPQFEYNQFVRDFRAANPARSFAEVLAAWKRRRDMPGTNRYQPEDAQGPPASEQ